MKMALLLTAITTLLGCSTAPSVQKANDSTSAFDGALFTGEKSVVGKSFRGIEEYRASYHGSFSSAVSAKEYATERADAFCGKQNKALNKISEQTATAPYIFFPKVEIIFSCIDKPKGIAMNANMADQYTQLRNLKSLLDDRILTVEEFEVEKKKILSK